MVEKDKSNLKNKTNTIRLKILRHFYRLDAKVGKHSREAKKYSISKESNKFGKKLNFIPKEISIKDKAKDKSKI